MFMLDLNCPRESGNMTSHAAEICFDKDKQQDKPMKLPEQTLFKSKGLYSILVRSKTERNFYNHWSGSTCNTGIWYTSDNYHYF